MKIHPRGVVRDLLGEDILSVLEGKGLSFLTKEDAVTEPVLDEAFGVLPFAQWGYESFIGIDLENFEIVQIASDLSLNCPGFCSGGRHERIASCPKSIRRTLKPVLCA